MDVGVSVATVEEDAGLSLPIGSPNSPGSPGSDWEYDTWIVGALKGLGGKPWVLEEEGEVHSTEAIAAILPPVVTFSLVESGG